VSELDTAIDVGLREMRRKQSRGVPPPPTTLKPEWDEIELQLWHFGAQAPIAIPKSTTSPRKLRRLCNRIISRAERIQRRGWRTAAGADGKTHHRQWDPHTALHFAMCELTNLHPGRRESSYKFTHFGMGGSHPKGQALSDWTTAYRIVDQALTELRGPA
jgi:hypothetical protein